MKAVAYSIKPCEKELLIKANRKRHDITLISNCLSLATVSYAKGKDAVLVCSCDDVSAPILHKLKEYGVKYISTRSTGTDHIDLVEAANLGIKVGNIPVYSAESTAEHAIALILALYRNIVPAHQKMLEHNFAPDDLVGSTIRSKTIGIVGFGQTGQALAQILRGFGARLLVCDIEDMQQRAASIGAEQVELSQIYKESDIISFHVPLTEQTRHMVNAETIRQMKDGVVLVNVSRGAVFNSTDVFAALQEEKISKIGMDVYEFEHNVFFFDHSRHPLKDELLRAFIEHPRVLLTPHQAFLTEEALEVIAEKTIKNLNLWNADKCVGPACCCVDACAVEPSKIAV